MLINLNFLRHINTVPWQCFPNSNDVSVLCYSQSKLIAILFCFCFPGDNIDWLKNQTNSNKNQLYKKRARWDPDQGELLFHTCLPKLLSPFALRFISTKVVRKKTWVNILGVVVILMCFFFSFLVLL